MKELGETLSWILGVAFFIALYCLFEGKPSLWDTWRQHAIQSIQCQPSSQGKS